MTCATLRTSFKVKDQGHKLTLSVRLISPSSLFRKQNAVPVSLEAGGAYRVRRMRRRLVVIDTCVQSRCDVVRLIAQTVRRLATRVTYCWSLTNCSTSTSASAAYHTPSAF